MGLFFFQSQDSLVFFGVFEDDHSEKSHLPFTKEKVPHEVREKNGKCSISWKNVETQKNGDGYILRMWF